MFEPRFTSVGEDGFPGPNGVDQLADRQIVWFIFYILVVYSLKYTVEVK